MALRPRLIRRPEALESSFSPDRIDHMTIQPPNTEIKWDRSPSRSSGSRTFPAGVTMETIQPLLAEEAMSKPAHSVRQWGESWNARSRS
jgi:hypothetical protein